MSVTSSFRNSPIGPSGCLAVCLFTESLLGPRALPESVLRLSCDYNWVIPTQMRTFVRPSLNLGLALLFYPQTQSVSQSIGMSIGRMLDARVLLEFDCVLSSLSPAALSVSQSVSQSVAPFYIPAAAADGGQPSRRLSVRALSAFFHGWISTAKVA